MKTLFASIALVALIPPSASFAAVGMTYLTAYDKIKGAQASAGRYGRQIRLSAVPSPANDTAKRAGRSARHTRKVALCGTAYYTTGRGVAWIDAHRKAGHELVVRKHVGKRKYEILCGKVPKRARAARKPSATGPAGDKSKME